MTPGGLFCVGVLDRSAWERGHPCALEEEIMAAQAGGVKKLRNLAGRAGQGAIALALALVSLAAAPTPPKIHADPMLHRLMRRHGVGVDTSGRPTPIGRSELEYYSKFLAVDPHGTPRRHASGCVWMTRCAPRSKTWDSRSTVA